MNSILFDTDFPRYLNVYTYFDSYQPTHARTLTFFVEERLRLYDIKCYIITCCVRNI
jgi:hypothetical protein